MVVINDLKNIQQNFVNELATSASGTKTSLAFIINQLPEAPLPKEGEVFQAMTIGGSVFKKGLVKKIKEGVEIVNKEEGPQPIFHTKQDLLNFLSNQLFPEVKILALNFAYPLDPVFKEGRLDGVLLKGSKEHRFEGLIGQAVGTEIEKYIKEKLGRDVLVSLANDTICLLLSGLTKYMYKQLAAGIVGTGMNFAFFLDPEKAVNLEAGSFDKFEQSREGKMIDQLSTSPGEALFEKEVSGAYLYQHLNLMMKDQPGFIPLKSSLELDELARSGSPLAEKAQGIIKRSASLIAAQIAGITTFCSKDMVFVMEGSLFWKGYQYKETVEQAVRELEPNFKVEFVHIEDSSILGAAELVI